MRLPEEPSSYGCPQEGKIYNIMRSTRLKFKSALRKFCKRHEIQNKSNSLAMSFGRHNSKDF